MSIMENKDIKTGLVIMASGLGKRFGGNKLMEPLNGKPLIKWIIDSTENLFDKRVVVTRNDDVRKLCEELQIQCVFHAFPGRNDTVRLGLSEVMGEVDYCFFTPGDQPLISQESITKLVECARSKSDKIVRPCYGDSMGAPVGFPGRFFEELLKLPEGKGGNWIVKSNQECVCSIEVHDGYELWDVDTVEDLEKIREICNKS